MKANKLLLALPIFFGLVGCAKTTTKKSTTSSKTTTKQVTTEKKTTAKQTTEKKTTSKKTTARQTTTRQTTTEYVSTEKLYIYCWDSSFKDVLDKYYSNVARIDGAKTVLKNGITINWMQLSNEVSIYQDGLDQALDAGIADIFMYEPFYAKKYVNSEYVVDMEALGVDQSDQFNYTKELSTNNSGKIVGSTWYVCPGVIAYNKKLANMIWPGVTQQQMEAKLSTYSNFLSSANDVIAAGKKMMIHPFSWYKMYCSNLDYKMYDGTTLTVDKNLFRWANDSVAMKDKGGFATIDKSEGMWSSKWTSELNDDNVLCYFSTTWANDYVIPSCRSTDDNGDLGLRVAAGYTPWFWNGALLSATKSSQEKRDVKDEVANIIKELTTNKTVLRAISDGEQYVTNSIDAMRQKGDDDKVSNPLFGGQNVFNQYTNAALLVNSTKEDLINSRLEEYFQAAFIRYIDESKTAEQAWASFKLDFRYYFPIDDDKIKLPNGVTIGDDIVID